ncbi:Ldh family oxidoreductase [Paenibacillus zeisoli]|uniref:Ldh family oxidoreductase n=1 Tax=Paenibacillus zeisoli TaxID=2496267 RepID=UPI00163B856D|nr:Ldh family oxidoreductase [Paenibacillus zeisoli]
MGYVTVKIDQLRRIGVQALVNNGLSEEEASYTFEDYLEAELRGRQSHGLSFIKSLFTRLETRGRYEVVRFENSYLHIQGNSDLGHVVARKAIDMALEKLPVSKSITIGISDVYRFNSTGLIAKYAAEKGAIAIVSAYGGNLVMAPVGALEKVVNNTPLGIAIPYTDPMFLLDMSMSTKAWGHITLARKNGEEEVPSDWGTDADGIPTTEPAEIKTLTPFGKYKGFALALALEILSGALVRVPIGNLGEDARRGIVIHLIDPTIFGHTVESFAEQVKVFLKGIQEVPTNDPSVEIFYPGQRSYESYKRQIEANEMEIHESILRFLQNQ